MASGSMKKGVSKDDLKRLMKKIRSEGTIKHPMAKYNSLGHLTCTVCNCQVKSDRLWNPHLLSRSHKEKLASPQAQPSISKRIQPEVDGVSAKRHKPETALTEKPKSILKNARAADLTAGYSSTDSECETNEQTKPDTTSDKGDGRQSLPADFFDTKHEDQTVRAEEDEPMDCKSTGSLPEGFFDDPKADAKARNIEYIDKDEVEWERFQSEMKGEVQVSEQLQAEEEEVTTEDRHLEEIDEQLAQWAKVNKMVKQKMTLMESKMLSVEESQAETMESDESDVDEFLDWRSKGLLS
ncbi:zinc finger protein 830-like [Watersipora subatra]|uniref:zinc finger protein 830-like n=1 Tax=Watersipora subatra TaxID=2589382 RepID=UPI00355B9BE5